MTREEASGLLSSLTRDEATCEGFLCAVEDFEKAARMVHICAENRRPHWLAQLQAARERLIDALTGTEPTDPLPGRAP